MPSDAFPSGTPCPTSRSDLLALGLLLAVAARHAAPMADTGATELAVQKRKTLPNAEKQAVKLAKRGVPADFVVAGVKYQALENGGYRVLKYSNCQIQTAVGGPFGHCDAVSPD